MKKILIDIEQVLLYFNEKDYEKALLLIQDVPEEVEVNPIIITLKMKCMYNLKQYEEVINEFNKNGDYFESDETFLEAYTYYINSLTMLEDFEYALDSLNEELALVYLDEEVISYLNDLYASVIEAKKVFLIENGLYENSYSDEEIISLLTSNDVVDDEDYEILLNAILSLEEKNVRKFIPEIKQYLINPQQYSVIKSMLLEILVSQQINENITIVKQGFEYIVNPLSLDYVFGHINHINVENLLCDNLDKEPSYLEMAKEINNLYAYMIYPLTYESSDVNIIAASIHYYVLSLNMDDDPYQVALLYQVSEEAISASVIEFANIISKGR
ncbi:MAG: tetratricopeptide repeat protein [Bacilli bacterium]